MKISSRTLLAAALLVALPTSGALACTVANWNGTNTATTAANAGGPADGIARYSGVCALSVDSGKYVTDNTPGAEGIYRARFYVLTANTGGTVTIFKAGSDDNAGGTSAIEVDFTGSSFAFRQNGASAGSVSGIQANKWYSIEMFYKAGNTFTASVWGAGGTSEVGNVNVTSAVGSATVGSARMGAISGSTGTAKLGFDAFESTRSETTAIGRLCRGDVNGDNKRNILDITSIVSNINGVTVVGGQPDASEDGVVSVLDVTTIVQWMNSSQGDCPV